MTLTKTERKRLEALKFHEQLLRQQGFEKIAGLDEAGRGPLAGPVIAAACILPQDFLIADINDSKQLTEEQREELFAEITQYPGVVFGIGIADVAEIDKLNILQASFLAMERAVAQLTIIPDYLLIDGPYRLPRNATPQKGIVDGDALSISIAAASILAKVTRDRIMIELDAQWPMYGFARHKGYFTDQHQKSLEEHGPCEHHRTSFEPVKNILGKAAVAVSKEG